MKISSFIRIIHLVIVVKSISLDILNNEKTNILNHRTIDSSLSENVVNNMSEINKYKTLPRILFPHNIVTKANENLINRKDISKALKTTTRQQGGGDTDEDDTGEDSTSSSRRRRRRRRNRYKVKKKYKKFLVPLLIAYKLKFFTLIPVFVSALVLLAGSTGMAGFFFALFMAVMGIKGKS